MRLTENQKAQLFRDYQEAMEALSAAREHLDELTDALGEASDTYSLCLDEKRALYAACCDGGVFDNE
jgi:hypothetical protein